MLQVAYLSKAVLVMFGSGHEKPQVLLKNLQAEVFHRSFGQNMFA
jgi:hypothetical protein